MQKQSNATVGYRYLRLISARSPRQTNPRTDSAAYPRFIVDEPIDEIADILTSAGVPIEEGPVDRTGAAGPIRSYVRDPDQTLIVLSNYR